METRLLVIEDEPEIADFVIRGLREEGYTVDHAADGKTGMQMIERDSWDAVLLDWWLPGMDGLTILRQFRLRDQRTPVLFLTARDAISDRVRGLDQGANDYLCKPFAFEELLARVRVLVRQKDTAEVTTVFYRDVSVNLVTQRAERAGKQIDLTAREYALLVFMLRHANELLPRSRIYSHVWDDTYDGLSNTLEVHIMELRKKLEMYGPRLIHTLRNRGYRFGDS